MPRFQTLVAAAALASALFLSAPAYCGNDSPAPDPAALDSASSEALQKTLSLLNSPSDRGATTENDPAAHAADAQVKALAGNAANTDAIYALSGEVLDRLVRQTGGDVTKMEEILSQAKSDPKAFYEKYFSAEDKAKLKNLAGQISPAAPASAPGLPGSSK